MIRTGWWHFRECQLFGTSGIEIENTIISESSRTNISVATPKKASFPMKERKWKGIPAYPSFRGRNARNRDQDRSRPRTGELLKTLRYEGLRVSRRRTSSQVVDVKRPILSVSRLNGTEASKTFIQAGKQFLRRFDGATVELTRPWWSLSFCNVQAVVSDVCLAPVVEGAIGRSFPSPTY